ncbi:MAG: ribonuclease E/G [Lachnospiraceae bacterium]|nr:ribonuclease E/G [Lachnospiraceae bacterium]
MEQLTAFFTTTTYDKQEYKTYGVIDANRKLQELFVEDLAHPSYVGNIYLARVIDVIPSISAAFVRLSGDIKAFLPFDACEHTPKPEEELLVQVTTDALKTKDAVATQWFELQSSHACLIEGLGNHGVSKKLDAPIRNYWKEYLKQYPSNSYHFLLRTNVSECSTEEVEAELQDLIRQREDILRRSKNATCFSLLYHIPTDYKQIMSGQLHRYIKEDTALRFVTDDVSVYEELVCVADALELDRSSVELYQDASYPLYKLYSISSQMEECLGKRIWLKSGANILIESMETMTVIDVNSSKISGKKRNFAMEINSEAAYEIARQIRLRNISGIILIDFINLKTKEEKELLSIMRDAVRMDRRKVVVVDMTALGFMELTREKVDKSLKQTLNMG